MCILLTCCNRVIVARFLRYYTWLFFFAGRQWRKQQQLRDEESAKRTCQWTHRTPINMRHRPTAPTPATTRFTRTHSHNHTRLDWCARAFVVLHSRGARRRRRHTTKSRIRTMRTSVSVLPHVERVHPLTGMCVRIYVLLRACGRSSPSSSGCCLLCQHTRARSISYAICYILYNTYTYATR